MKVSSTWCEATEPSQSELFNVLIVVESNSLTNYATNASSTEEQHQFTECWNNLLFLQQSFMKVSRTLSEILLFP